MRAAPFLALAFAALALVGGCTWIKGHTYQAVPVANAIGDSTVQLGGNRFHVISAERYAILGPSSAAVTGGAEQLDRAYFQWHRFFAERGVRVAVVLFDRPDSNTREISRLLAMRGFDPVAYVRSKSDHDAAGLEPAAANAALWPFMDAVADALLSDYVAARRHWHASSTADSPHDTLSRLFPRWYRRAVATLLGDPSAPDRAVQVLHDHRDQLVPIALVLGPQRGVIHDTTDEGRRQQDIIDAEGVSFLEYASEQESPRFLRTVADEILAGGTAESTLRAARSLPHDVAQVEHLWLHWLHDQDN